MGEFQEALLLNTSAAALVPLQPDARARDETLKFRLTSNAEQPNPAGGRFQSTPADLRCR